MTRPLTNSSCPLAAISPEILHSGKERGEMDASGLTGRAILNIKRAVSAACRLLNTQGTRNPPHKAETALLLPLIWAT